jgi:hypothetical protein
MTTRRDRARASIAGRAVFVPAQLITTIAPGAIEIREPRLDRSRFGGGRRSCC